MVVREAVRSPLLYTSAQMQPSGRAYLHGLAIIEELGERLRERGILCCHWKSNLFLERTLCGDNDLDLLVDRADAGAFLETLCRLGFKPALDAPAKQAPGVVDYYALDPGSGRLVHAHVHYQLVLGHDATKNYRLPIERAYLRSAIRQTSFPTPTPEFEFVVLVIRLALKHLTWDAILARHERLAETERKEFDDLYARVDWPQVYFLLEQSLPCLDAGLFDACVAALRTGVPALVRVWSAHQLQRRLRLYARRAGACDLYLKLWRRATDIVRRRLLRQRTGSKHLASGGALIGLVGGDGAGKSTAAHDLSRWLSKDFETVQIHMGKPPWSLTTVVVRCALKVGRLLGLWPFLQAPLSTTLQNEPTEWIGYPWLIREVCTARDRYLAYARARRAAASGALVVLDRYPLAELKLMDGPQCRKMTGTHGGNRLIWMLVAQEERYYRAIAWPEVLCVLKLPPETAVQRKADEDAAYVRARSGEVWWVDWRRTPAVVVNADRSKEQVLADLKAAIWSRL